MTIKVATFRQKLLEFTDSKRYPDAVVEYWLEVAAQFVNEQRWGTLTENGILMFAAHHVALERRAMDEADSGQVPGGSVGIVNNKSVDKVSIGYDTTGGAELDAGHWNLTIYGSRFIRVARMMGAGGIQIGTSCVGSSPLSSANAWAGPWLWNFPNPS